MKKLNIAILGYGVIGKGVFEICKNMPYINVVKILERKEKFDSNYPELFTDNYQEIFGNLNYINIWHIFTNFKYTFSNNSIAKNSNIQFFHYSTPIISTDLTPFILLKSSFRFSIELLSSLTSIDNVIYAVSSSGLS